jgi:hypothetical protein
MAGHVEKPISHSVYTNHDATPRRYTNHDATPRRHNNTTSAITTNTTSAFTTNLSHSHTTSPITSNNDKHRGSIFTSFSSHPSDKLPYTPTTTLRHNDTMTQRYYFCYYVPSFRQVAIYTNDDITTQRHNDTTVLLLLLRPILPTSCHIHKRRHYDTTTR